MLNRKVIYSCGALLCTGHLLNAALTEKVLLSPTRLCKFAPPLVRHQDMPFAQFAIDFSTMSEDDSLKLQKQRKEILNIRKQWQEILGKHNISLDQLDRLFPTLSFRLAAQLPEDIEELRTATQKAIQSSLKTAIPITAQEFYPCSSRLIIGGSCKEMAKALFGDVEYMLKLKSALKGNAQNEAFAGEKIRLAAVQEIVKFLGESLSIESDQVPTGLEYLAFIVAPIDCGDHIASRKILNAIELKEIIMTQTKSQSPISSKKETPIEGLPLPDFNDFESQDLLRNSFKSMDFGNAQQRIEMFKILTKIVKFLNNNEIFHNDLNSGNFLIEDNKYFRIYVIDFDRAKFKASNNDSQKFPELCLEYLLHSTKSCSLEDIISSWKNEFPFSYTSEELKQIKKLYITAHSVELQQD